ncbi:unnamed protein product [Hymenolepis diminuta]|uniref:DUF2052 domain-containing protein n=1 Tax=Hymenolepis diminuta TaxID=6216 RepID=A0A0R3SA59_HYMDI|nr:unnamed protein product [Hymenolepis diminuta]
MWEKANNYYLKAFPHHFVSTERSTIHLNISDEIKMNGPSSPYEEKENVETSMQNLLLYLEEEHLKHNSSTDSMKPLCESSSETNHVEEEDYELENVPVVKELREELWGNKDENCQINHKYILYGRICEAFEQYNRYRKSPTPPEETVEKVEPGQQENPKPSSNPTIDVLKLLHEEITISADEEDK